MTPGDDEAILDILERWEDARAAGHDLSVVGLCGDRPDLVEVARAKIAALQSSDWMGPASLAATGSRVLAGRYRLESLVGQGGHGQVWRAYDEELRRPVAVKIPQPSRRLGEGRIDQLLTEARSVARLRHPGVVPVHDVVKEGAAYFIVSDFIDGEDLAERLRRGPLPVAEAVRIVLQVARVLDYAHGQGIVHRDIKPSNVLLSPGGGVHVCDFGIAATQAELANGGDRRATLAYASPEQLGDGPVDHRTDIWSLGVVLAEILTGRRPFDDDDPVRLRRQILTADVPAVAGVPDSVAAVCRRCLAKTPEGRFARGGEVAAALEVAGGVSLLLRWPARLGVLGLFGVGLLAVWLGVRPQVRPTNPPPETAAGPNGDAQAGETTDRAVAAWTLSAGGRVRLRPADGRPEFEVAAPAPPPLGEWHVVAVFLADAPAVSDADVRRLTPLGKLKWVSLSRTGVTHAGLAHLKASSSPEVLDLEGMRLDDRCYDEVAGMTGLRVLHLGGSTVTTANLKTLGARLRLRTLGVNWVGLGDDGLGVVADFAGLEELDASGAKLTAAGVRQLRRAGGLRVLAVNRVPLGPEVVRALGELTQVRRLYAQETDRGGDDAVGRELRRLLPQCEVTR